MKEPRNLVRLRELAAWLEEEDQAHRYAEGLLELPAGQPLEPRAEEAIREWEADGARVARLLEFVRSEISAAEQLLYRKPDNATGPRNPADESGHT